MVKTIAMIGDEQVDSTSWLEDGGDILEVPDQVGLVLDVMAGEHDVEALMYQVAVALSIPHVVDRHDVIDIDIGVVMVVSLQLLGAPDIQNLVVVVGGMEEGAVQGSELEGCQSPRQLLVELDTTNGCGKRWEQQVVTWKLVNGGPSYGISKDYAPVSSKSASHGTSTLGRQSASALPSPATRMTDIVTQQRSGGRGGLMMREYEGKGMKMVMKGRATCRYRKGQSTGRMG